MSTAAPLPDKPITGNGSLPQAEHLPDDPGTLKQMILELLATLHQERRNKDKLQQRLDQLLRRLYGRKSEHYNPDQPLLFAELLAAAQEQAEPPPVEAEAEEAKPQRRRGRPHGRRRLPDNLQREAEHYQLTEAERVCPGCGQVRIEIGTDQSEMVDYRPASFFIRERITHKYACPHCAGKESTMAASVSAEMATQAEATETSASASAAAAADTSVEVMVPATAAASAATPVLPATAAAAADRPVELPLLGDPNAAIANIAVLPAEAAGMVVSAPTPPPIVVKGIKLPGPIAKGLPGAGLLAYLIVSKYVDHLPLYRLERICERQGLFLPRSTTCDWMAACAELLRPLYGLMVSQVLQSQVIHTDDTPVHNQRPPPGETDIGRLWVYLGDAAHAYNVFDFTPNRRRDGPQQFLANFCGYLQADAFGGYDALYLPDRRDGVAAIHEVACNAHARRKFHEASGSDAARSHVALGYYRQLYEIERRATRLGADEGLRLQMRQDLAVLIWNQFRAWLEAQRSEVLPKSPMAEAIGYALNNWSALVRYTEAGFLAIDNNWAEREMKRVAIGRKNWLFVGSVQGGKTAAVLFTMTSTCQRLGIEPWAYLQDVLTRLPTTPAAQLAELLPDRWQASQAAAAAGAAQAAAAATVGAAATASTP